LDVYLKIGRAIIEVRRDIAHRPYIESTDLNGRKNTSKKELNI
jgi:hypothetical protein